MNSDLHKALIKGTERLAAWADLLDHINVFPVADGDTGRNMVTSLSALKQADPDRKGMARKLLLSARGNSGNIAARFIAGLLTADSLAFLPPA
ncbi:MAG TPA: DAK2 domain-containing protein, partial [Deltaproteobacteria bacterium]|nr:DAK2 domain-containing protein [Deltaproteobacteria bacterium]